MSERCSKSDHYDTDLSHARGFDNSTILDIANIQVRRILDNPLQSAAQRQYDRMVRREIRRRGLKWSPPKS